MTRIGVIRGSSSFFLALGYAVGATADADTEYFPPRAFVEENLPKGRADISGMLADRYSDALRRMNEPSLWKLSQKDKRPVAYRFLWLPTEGRPVAVRIQQAGGRVSLDMVRLDGDGGYDLGKPLPTKRVILSQGQWDRLAQQVEVADFWAMTTRINDLGHDGENLIVEGVEGGKYHVVDRWTPEPGVYRELCRSMLDLTGQDLGQKAWPAPPPPSLSWARVIVILTGLALAAILGVACRRILRRRKPKKPVGLTEWT